jgi:L-ribulose-5-phosphate 4-epimerase
MLSELKNHVLHANQDLVKFNLVTLTWGNVSGISRAEGLVVIKPSGLAYARMKLEDMAVVDMDGRQVEGKLRPSSDTATHIELYKAFPDIGGITHSHSEYATMFAQACCEIPCFGTTHADHFCGSVPVTRFLTEDEVTSEYELSTGKVIVERFHDLDPIAVPGVLVAGHGPFTWGKDARDSVRNSLVLNRIAEMAIGTLQLDPQTKPIPDYLIDKHYKRKHGPEAYYGQK